MSMSMSMSMSMNMSMSMSMSMSMNMQMNSIVVLNVANDSQMVTLSTINADDTINATTSSPSRTDKHERQQPYHSS